MVKFQPSKLAMRVRFPLPAVFHIKSTNIQELVITGVRFEIVHVTIRCLTTETDPPFGEADVYRVSIHFHRVAHARHFDHDATHAGFVPAHERNTCSSSELWNFSTGDGRGG